MSYDMEAHRRQDREWCLLLAAAGPGWHAYAIDKARRFVKADPTLHQDLVQAVQAVIDAAPAAGPKTGGPDPRREGPSTRRETQPRDVSRTTTRSH